MSQENVEFIRGVFEATNRRDWGVAMDAYAEDVQLVVSDAWPGSGTYSGKEAVGAWFGDWLGTFERGYRFEIEEIADISNAVVVITTHTGRGRRSGAQIKGRTAQAYWVRDGKIVRVEVHEGRRHALEAVGLGD